MKKLLCTIAIIATCDANVSEGMNAVNIEKMKTDFSNKKVSDNYQKVLLSPSDARKLAELLYDGKISVSLDDIKKCIQETTKTYKDLKNELITILLVANNEFSSYNTKFGYLCLQEIYQHADTDIEIAKALILSQCKGGDKEKGFNDDMDIGVIYSAIKMLQKGDSQGKRIELLTFVKENANDLVLSNSAQAILSDVE